MHPTPNSSARAPGSFLWGHAAWLSAAASAPGRWGREVLMRVGADGHWLGFEEGVSRADALRRTAKVLDGPVVPGLVNAHSHAFQRAIVGMTERSAGQGDDFWSWREHMYAAALRISPAQLEAIATQLYSELLAGGFTQVCEFHYLHLDPTGKPYANPAEMSLALVRAAQVVGIGLTLLPTLYMRSGFGATALRTEQRRFAGTPESIVRTMESVAALGLPNVNTGLAIHSLRAVDAGPLRESAQAARAAGRAVHIHIAEQTGEVQDCLAQHGERPIEHLLRIAPVDAGWNLVHATHTLPNELDALAASGASIVICPSTEANLGDGVFDLPGWLTRRGGWSVGTDSHVGRRANEELRLLEYSQRLILRQRNVAARAAGRDSSGEALIDGARMGGSAAAGLPLGGLLVGQRADWVELSGPLAHAPDLPLAQPADAWVFGAADAGVRRVGVAGREIHFAPQPNAAYRRVLAELWG